MCKVWPWHQQSAVSLRTAQSGYPCLSLHGGKDQSDRESTISDFKSNVCNVLVATSVAARGLDVKDLVRCVCWSISTSISDNVPG